MHLETHSKLGTIAVLLLVSLVKRAALSLIVIAFAMAAFLVVYASIPYWSALARIRQARKKRLGLAHGISGLATAPAFLPQPGAKLA